MGVGGQRRSLDLAIFCLQFLNAANSVYLFDKKKKKKKKHLYRIYIIQSLTQAVNATSSFAILSPSSSPPSRQELELESV